MQDCELPEKNNNYIYYTLTVTRGILSRELNFNTNTAITNPPA